MVLKAKGKIMRKGRWGGLFVYIPADVVKDSQFPEELRLDEKEKSRDVMVEIDPTIKAIVITPTKLEREER